MWIGGDMIKINEILTHKELSVYCMRNRINKDKTIYGLRGITEKLELESNRVTLQIADSARRKVMKYLKENHVEIISMLLDNEIN